MCLHVISNTVPVVLRRRLLWDFKVVADLECFSSCSCLLSLVSTLVQLKTVAIWDSVMPNFTQCLGFFFFFFNLLQIHHIIETHSAVVTLKCSFYNLLKGVHIFWPRRGYQKESCVWMVEFDICRTNQNLLDGFHGNLLRGWRTSQRKSAKMLLRFWIKSRNLTLNRLLGCSECSWGMGGGL